MERYLIAFRLNEKSNARTNVKDQVKTFEEEKDATAFVTSLATSNTRELISVSHHDFITHETLPLELQLVTGKLKLVPHAES